MLSGYEITWCCIDGAVLMVHRVALIVPYDAAGQVLLQHRTEDAPRLPGYWGFFGGGIQDTESPLAAVIRETKEELSLDLVKPVLVLERDFKLPGLEGHAHVFVEEVLDKNGLCLGEGQGWGWFKEPDLKPLKMMPHDREILRRVFDFIAGN